MSDVTTVDAPEPDDEGSGKDVEADFYCVLADAQNASPLPTPEIPKIEAEVEAKRLRMETPIPLPFMLAPATGVFLRQRSKHLRTTTLDPYAVELLDKVFFIADQCCRFFIANGLLSIEEVV